MPPLRLTVLLQTALPEVSPASRAIISTLGCLNGKPPSAEDVATWVGLRDRFQLARALRRDGLPPLEQLAGWARVLHWLLRAETTGATLRQLAKRDGVDPAVAYRLVQRLTGLHWSEARRAGLPGAVFRLREHQSLQKPGGHKSTAPRPAAPPDGNGAKGAIARLAIVERHAPSISLRVPRHPHGIMTDRLSVPGSPFDVTISPDGIALVTRVHAAAVDMFRVRPLSRIGVIRTSPTPTRVLFASGGTRAYVTNQFAQEIAILDLGAMCQRSAVAVAGDPLGMAMSPDERTLFITTNLDRLTAVSLASEQVISSTPIPLGQQHLAVDPSGRRVYTPCWKAGVVIEADTRNLQVRRRFEVGGEAQDAAISPDGLRLYVANQCGWLNVIQLTSGHIQTVQLGAPAISLSLSPDGAVLFVGLVFHGRVLMLDAHTLHMVGEIKTGGMPRRIAFDQTGTIALIANEMGWIDLVT